MVNAYSRSLFDQVDGQVIGGYEIEKTEDISSRIMGIFTNTMNYFKECISRCGPYFVQAYQTLGTCMAYLGTELVKIKTALVDVTFFSGSFIQITVNNYNTAPQGALTTPQPNQSDKNTIVVESRNDEHQEDISKYQEWKNGVSLQFPPNGCERAINAAENLLLSNQPLLVSV